MKPTAISLGGPTSTCSVTQLRRLAAGELPAEAASTLRQHLADCRRCRLALANLTAEATHLNRELPFESFAAGVAEALAAGRLAAMPPPASPWGERGRRLTIVAVPLAAAAALVVSATPLLFAKAGAEHGYGAVKGGAGAELFVRDVAGTRRLEPQTPLADGAELLLELRPGGRRYVAAALREPSGASLLYAGVAQPGPLPSGFVWDGRGRARVLVRFGDRPIDVADWLAALARGNTAVAGGDEIWSQELSRP